MSTGGDFLFQPRHQQYSSSRWRGLGGGGRLSREEDHLAQIIELMGPIPKDVLDGGRYSGRWFGRGGEY
jgi:serine/threonine-protein kinase SRPK3